MGAKDLFPYEKYKAKFGKERRYEAFNVGLWEIVNKPDATYLGNVSRSFSEILTRGASHDMSKLTVGG